MHIDILVPKAIVGFDAQKPVGDSNAGGGMGIKYARVEEALLHRYPSVSRISRLDKVTADVVMIDPTLFVWGTTVPTVAELQELEIPFSLLSCEEQTIMGLPNRNRRDLVKSSTWITHNGVYLRSMLRSCGIYQSQFLCAPVPEHLFYPAKKVPRIVAIGQVSWEKNTEAVIDIFRALQGSGIETVYIGSATSWGLSDYFETTSLRHRLEDSLREVTDVFLGNVSQQEVARWLNTSMHHLHVAHYDTSCQNQQEAALSGCILWGLTHPLSAERPVFWFEEPLACAEAIRGYTYDAGRAEEIHRHALAKWSYAAFLNQFDKLMMEV